MNPPPGISIIICTWNRAQSLHTTLTSLNAQQHCEGHAIEVVVVDNNSHDQTKAVVEALRPNWRLGTLLYTFEPRQGKQFALNRGVNASAHDILAFTDDDILFAEDWVREIRRVFTAHAVDLVGGKTLVTWPASGPPPWYHPSMAAVLGAIDLGDQRQAPAPPSYAPAGANLIVRRSLLQRIGGFSESHFRHMDFEFGMRSARRKASIAYEPRLVVFAPVAPACLTKRYFRRWSFKAGITHDSNEASPGEPSPSAPLWIYRQLLEDCIALVLTSWRKPAAQNFFCELRAWRSFGKIAGYWHHKLRPGQHEKWIEHFSQKKKNVY